MNNMPQLFLLTTLSITAALSAVPPPPWELPNANSQPQEPEVTVQPLPIAAIPISATTTTTAAFEHSFCPSNAGGTCSDGTGVQNIVSDVGGALNCQSYQCCQCESVTCGLNGVPCHNVAFADYAVIGVQDIQIEGTLSPLWIPGSNTVPGQWQQGASVSCTGTESCRNAHIVGNLVRSMFCLGPYACAQTTILLTEPAPTMDIACSGAHSCLDAHIEVDVGTAPPPGKICNPQRMPNTIALGNIVFGAAFAGENTTITIVNRGCDVVMVNHIDCSLPDACNGAQFVIVGNVQIQQCDLSAAAAEIPQQCLHSSGVAVGSGVVYGQYEPSTTAETIPAVIDSTTSTTTPTTTAAPLTTTTTTTAAPQSTVWIMGDSGDQVCFDTVQCANQAIQILDPLYGWDLECRQTGSCSGMTLLIDFTPGYFVTLIDGFAFYAANSSQNAVIKVPSNYYLEIHQLECLRDYACNGLTIEFGPGVDLYNFHVECNTANACDNCFVIQGIHTIPCEELDAAAFPSQYLPPPWNPAIGGPQVVPPVYPYQYGYVPPQVGP